MRRPNPETLARIYLITVLLLSVLVSSLFQIGLALALLAVQLILFYFSSKSSINVILIIVSLILAPLALEAIAGPFIAILLTLPGLILFDSSLKNYVVTQPVVSTKTGRNASNLLKTLSTSLIVIFLVSVIAWNLTLVLASSVLITYLIVTSAYTYRKIPAAPLNYHKASSRLLAGESDTKIINLISKPRIQTRIALRPFETWSRVEPTNFIFTSGVEKDVSIDFTPELAGPSSIKIQASIIDSRGLIAIGQILELVDLHIIPKAKFAQWLANKFLKQTSAGAGHAVAIPWLGTRQTHRGVEFYGVRPYQAGDRWRDIDWKHSYMLGELISKEYSGGQGQRAIIVADLTANDVDSADKLAYNFVMSALTFAVEALPSSLAVYNQQEVLAVTQPLNPRETLKEALGLTAKITVAKSKDKVLQPTEVLRLNRAVRELDKLQNEPGKGFSEVLKFEIEVLQETANQHPVSKALNKATQNMQSPAALTVISDMSHDPDTLLFTLERFKEKGFSIIMVS